VFSNSHDCSGYFYPVKNTLLTPFYFTYYTSQNSPYRTLFGLNGGDSEMTIDDANNWIQQEQGLPNLKDKFNTENGNWVASVYSLTETRTLTNSSWNFFGFASIYIKAKRSING
jgi:hypothetical protein